jgi:hypothetical protein
MSIIHTYKKNLLLSYQAFISKQGIPQQHEVHVMHCKGGH